jgi:hypothetical protein
LKDLQFGGVSLIDQRWGITFIPDTIPARRGENIVVPYLDGARFVKKNYDQRTETINMWVTPYDQTGVIPSGKTPKQQLEENMDYLKSLFGSPVGLVAYRKQMDNGSWRTANVEVSNAIEFTKPDDFSIHRVFSVELRFPDPFFYAEIATSDTITPNSAAYSITHINPGTAVAKKLLIFNNGGLVNPKIENLDLGVWAKINSSIASGAIVTVDTGGFAVTDSNGNDLIQTFAHSGDPAWMLLKPGVNNMKLTCDETPTGNISLQYFAPYI